MARKDGDTRLYKGIERQVGRIGAPGVDIDDRYFVLHRRRSAARFHALLDRRGEKKRRALVRGWPVILAGQCWGRLIGVHKEKCWTFWRSVPRLLCRLLSRGLLLLR